MNSINKINFKIFKKKKININYFSSGFNKIVEQTKKFSEYYKMCIDMYIQI